MTGYQKIKVGIVTTLVAILGFFGVYNQNQKDVGTFIPVSPTPLDIARGNVSGQSIVSDIARNPVVSTVFEDIWDAGDFSTLAYDAQSGNFTPGLTVTSTSGGTAVIVTDVDDGATGTLTIRKITGTFLNNETITDSSTGSATTNSTSTPVLARVDPTSGQTWEVIAESANDSSAGTGAQTILLSFIDDTNKARVTEIISLNGHTAVTVSSTDAFRFESAAVLTWGSATDEVFGKTNLGTIVIRDSSTKNIQGAILYDDSNEGDEHGFNNTQDSHYYVPAGKTAFLTLLVTNTTKNHDVTLRSLIKLDGSEGYITAGEMGNYQNSFILSLENGPAALPEKTDFKLIGRSNNTAVPIITQVLITEIDN